MNMFHFLADEEQLTDELFAFITAHASSRHERPFINALYEVAPHMISIAECMIIDGVDERHFVAEYVHAVVSGEGMA